MHTLVVIAIAPAAAGMGRGGRAAVPPAAGTPVVAKRLVHDEIDD